MRPDTLFRINTNDTTQVDFIPQRLLTGKLVRSFAGLLMIQMLFVAVVLCVALSPMTPRWRGDLENQMARRAAEGLATNDPNRLGAEGSRFMLQMQQTDHFAFAVAVGTDNRVLESWQSDGVALAQFSEKYVDAGRVKGLPLLEGRLWLPLDRVVLHEVPIPSGSAEAGGMRLLYATTSAAYENLLLMIGASVVFGCFSSYFLARKFIKRKLRRWNVGLKQLFKAIQTLARGARPKPLPVGDSDEIGFLQVAFNEMASKLLASREALIEANETLEQRVDQRTTELHEASQRLDVMASTDPMTGLYNRRALDVDAQAVFENARAENIDVACMLIDLDGFKQINDTLGHKLGDEILHAAASALKRSCRDDDMAIRLGGDEFLLVWTGVPLTRLHAAADTIQTAFQEATAKLLPDEDAVSRPSMSIGIATRLQEHTDSLDELLKRADAAMYQAKRDGKGHAILHEPSTTGAQGAADEEAA